MALTMARIVARESHPPPVPTMPSDQRSIVAQVAAKHGLEPGDLFRRTFAGIIVRARHEAWFRILSETDTNMSRVACRWGWDRVAILRGIGKHRARMACPELVD